MFSAVRLLDHNGSLSFFLKLRTLCDIVAISSVFYAVYADTWITLSFLRAVQLRFAVRHMELSKLLGWSDFGQQLENLAVDAAVLVFTFASVIWTIEWLSDLPSVGMLLFLSLVSLSCSLSLSLFLSLILISSSSSSSSSLSLSFSLFLIPDPSFSFSPPLTPIPLLYPPDVFEDRDSWHFLNAVYFIFITISTVGYGDLSPDTIVGRLCVIAFVVIGVIVFSNGLTQLAELANNFKSGLGKFTNRSGYPFVLVCGKGSLSMIQDLLHEFYHSERLMISSAVENRRIVILTEATGADLESMFAFIRGDRFLRRQVTILVGSPLIQHDLERAKASDAEACFIMNDTVESGNQSKKDDVFTIFRAVSIRRNCPQVPIFLLLQTHASKAKVTSTEIPFHNLVFRDQLKMGLLALSCIAPGFSTVIYNLIRSRASYDGSEDNLATWKKEYYMGASKELYIVELKKEFVGKPFRQVAKQVHETLCVILLGYVHEGVVNLNPDGTVPTGSLGLIIAEDDSEADKLGIPTYMLAKHEKKETIDNLERIPSSDTGRREKHFPLDVLPRRTSTYMHHTGDPNEEKSDSRSNSESRKEAVELCKLDGENKRRVESREEKSDHGRIAFDPDVVVRHTSIGDDRSGAPRVGRGLSSRSLPISDEVILQRPPIEVCRDHIVVVTNSCSAIQHFIRPIRERERQLRARTTYSEDAVRCQPIVILCA